MITRIEVGELTPDVVSKQGVVCINVGRKLSPEQLVEIACIIGKPQAFHLQKYRPSYFPPEVTLLDNRGDSISAAPSGFGEGWHQDSTYLPNPPEFTVLHAIEVPDCGGDTLFADTRPAMLALSSTDVTTLSKLTLVHALTSTYRIAASDAGKTLGELMAQLPRTSHPIVMHHPRGGTTLCISPLYSNENVVPEARELYDRVLREVIRGEVAHRWRAGEVLIWDNRVVLHAATVYLGEQRRTLMRSVVRDTGEEQ
jgi:taurine dioxygenase